MKKTLIALVVLMLLLSSCTDTARRDTPTPADTPSQEQESAPIPDAGKIAAEISSSADFKAGGTLKNIRVYFDNAGVKKRYEERLPDEDAMIAYKTEHNMEDLSEPYELLYGIYSAVISEEIKNEITAVLEASSIAADGDRLQFGTSLAYLNFTEMTYNELAALSLDSRVTRIVPFDESAVFQLSEAEIEKIEPEYHPFSQMLSEALPDDVFSVSVGIVLMERDSVSSSEETQSGDEYAAQKLGYTREDIERLVKEATDYDTEHGKAEFNPTEEQAARIREMQDAYQAALAEHYLMMQQPSELTDEEKAICEKRYKEFLERNSFVFGEDIDQVVNPWASLTGEMRAEDIVKILRQPETDFVSLEVWPYEK